MKAMPFRPHEPLWPFPRLPEAVTAGYPGAELTLRPFGRHESDLSVDFERTPRPVLVTHLLECCTRDAERECVDPELLWHLAIGKRIECLLTLLSSEPETEIHAAFRCQNRACGETSEIEIAVGEIAELQDHAYATDPVLVPLQREVVALRRPTGSDQLAWLRSGFTDEKSAVTAMLRTLVMDDTRGASPHDDTLDDEELATIEQAMEEHDPLVRFHVLTRCPACDAENPVAIDLEELALRCLRQAQRRLLASVHRLAAHYHWSEQQIFAVPYWRRAQYLGLIDGEKTP